MKYIKKLLILLLLLIPFNVLAEDIDLYSTNAIVINLNNNEILYEKNKDEVINVASMQKIMTAIVAIQNIKNFDKPFELEYGIFNDLDIELMKVGFEGGESVTYNDLLYGTLLKSGADGAYGLGVNISGSEDEFVKLMNDEATKLKLTNSVFKNTTGLDADGQHSSVYDIANLLKYSLNNKTFKKIFTTKEYETNNGYHSFYGPIAKARDYDMDYFKGGKTGFTDEAGKCLASYGEKDGVKFIVVTAGASDDIDNSNYLDHKTLYEYFINNYSFKTIIDKNEEIDKINTIYKDEVILNAPKKIELYLSNDIEKDDLNIYYKGKTELDRSIKEGDKIGKYIIEYEGKKLYEENVYSPITVNFKLRTPYKIVLGLLLLSFLFRILNKKKRKRRRKRY